MIAALSITTGASAVIHGEGANDGGKHSNVAVGYEAQATGQSDSVAVGYKSKATGPHSQAIGNYASAITQSTAIGTSAAAKHQDSVALGINSATDRGNSVSVGNAAKGIYRQVTNVADGTKATDAATFGQMSAADETLQKNIDANADDISLLKQENIKQDERLTNVEDKNTTQDSQIGALQATDTKHDNQIGALQATDTKHDSQIGALQATDTKHDSQIGALQATDTKHDNQIGALQATDTKHDNQISALQTTDQGFQNKFDTLESVLGSGFSNPKFSSLRVGNISSDGTNINMGGGRITGLSDGGIYRGSTDAVTGNQLWDAYQRMDDLQEGINIVGAHAAALSGLHPIDYNPFEPTTLSAAVGTYRDEYAVAVGVFHYMRENVLFNLGASLCSDGDLMGRAGISFTVGKSGKKEQPAPKDMREVQAQLAQVQQALAELKAENEALKVKLEEK